MRYLTLAEVVALQDAIITRTGGASGLRDFRALDSALAQPRATLGGQELHASWGEKAAALGFSFTQNHPFVDGNKRVAHAAMETFRMLNGAEIDASVDEGKNGVPYNGNAVVTEHFRRFEEITGIRGSS